VHLGGRGLCERRAGGIALAVLEQPARGHPARDRQPDGAREPGSRGDDPALRSFLDSKQIGGDWESTQTIAPAGFAAEAPGPDSAALSWTPILYAGDTGGYRIAYGTIPGGPYNVAGTTPDKLASTFTVSGLGPATSYYLVTQTLTNPHAENANTVVSERSAEVHLTTTGGGTDVRRLTVTTHGPGTLTSSPGGIACGGVCTAAYAPGTPITLSAAPADGSAFLGWGGACSGLSPTCDLSMDSELSVAAAFSPPATSFYTVTPCRAYDSRGWAGVSGPGPIPLAAGTETAVVLTGYCGLPTTAKAASLNVAVVSPTAAGHLRLYPAGTARPGTSSINYAAGQTRANNAVVPLGEDGALVVYASQPSGTTTPRRRRERLLLLNSWSGG
jgi:hypothetical protein